jgi:hypothetical protein
MLGFDLDQTDIGTNMDQMGSTHLPDTTTCLSQTGLKNVHQVSMEAEAHLVGDGLADTNVDADDVEILQSNSRFASKEDMPYSPADDYYLDIGTGCSGQALAGTSLTVASCRPSRIKFRNEYDTHATRDTGLLGI